MVKNTSALAVVSALLFFAAAVRLLDRLPGWTRVYSDDIAVVHVRRAATASVN